MIPQRKIGDTFFVERDGKSHLLEVKERVVRGTCFDYDGNLCFYRRIEGCCGILSVTGDCMARYRKDHTHVVFIEVKEGGVK